MLTHEEVEERGMVDAYVRRRLVPEDCAAFEEHYFQCAKCFDDVQFTGRLVQGVAHAVRAGLLDPVPEPQPGPRWAMPALVFATSLATVLAGVLLFLVLVRQPGREAVLRQEVEHAHSQARASSRRAAELAARESGTEANVPVVILTASRSGGLPNPVELGPQSRRVLLWIDVPAQPPGTRFGLSLSSDATGFRTTIDGLERNASGALAAILPAAGLPAGVCTVRLFDERSTGKTIAEYRLKIARR